MEPSTPSQLYVGASEMNLVAVFTAVCSVNTGVVCQAYIERAGSAPMTRIAINHVLVEFILIHDLLMNGVEYNATV